MGCCTLLVQAEAQQRGEEAVAEAKPIVADFSRRWKQSVEILHKVQSSDVTCLFLPALLAKFLDFHSITLI